MEKVSINDLLSLLLPGLFLFLSGGLVNNYCPHYFHKTFQQLFGIGHESEFFNTIFFLLVSIVCGAFVHGVTYYFIRDKHLKIYNRFTGLFQKTGIIFAGLYGMQHYTPFFDADCQKVFNVPFINPAVKTEKEKETLLQQQGAYFDYMFYYLTAQGKMSEARSNQNFYFLFRNLFTVNVLIIMSCLILSLVFVSLKGWSAVQPLALIALSYALLAYIVFAPLGRWYRKRMVRNLFFQYYMLRNTDINGQTK
jgi:hypothetical protein